MMWFTNNKITYLQHEISEREQEVDKMSALYFKERKANKSLQLQKDNLTKEKDRLEELLDDSVQLREDECNELRSRVNKVSSDLAQVKSHLIAANQSIDARDDYWGQLAKRITDLLQPTVDNYYSNGLEPWDSND